MFIGSKIDSLTNIFYGMTLQARYFRYNKKILTIDTAIVRLILHIFHTEI